MYGQEVVVDEQIVAVDEQMVAVDEQIVAVDGHVLAVDGGKTSIVLVTKLPLSNSFYVPKQELGNKRCALDVLNTKQKEPASAPVLCFV